MTDQRTAQEVAAKIQALRGELTAAQRQAQLSDLRTEIGNLASNANNLAQKVAELRAKGYVFQSQLEGRASALATQWGNISSGVSVQVSQQALLLQAELRPVESLVMQVAANEGNPEVARALLAQAQAALMALQGRIEGAVGAIRASYAPLSSELSQIQAEMQRLTWMLEQLAEASFQPLANEGIIQSVKATWVQGEREDKDDPQGLLFLTDRRLLFEQKQDVATKKVLFITTQKQRVQKLLWEAPIGDVESVVASKRGLLGHEDHLEFAFTSQTWGRQAHLHIDGQDCKLWQRQVGRAKAGEFEAERVGRPEGQPERPLPVLPEKCPGCGGPIGQQVTRGMDSITCKYCGRVIRL